MARCLPIAHRAPAALAEFSTCRQQGEPWNFGPELVEQFKARIADMIPLTPDGLPAPTEGTAPPGAVPSAPDE